MRGFLEQWFLKAWQQDAGLLWVLRPLAGLYGWLAAQRQTRRSATDPGTTPVVVVGNITVGGSGKTPLLIAMAKQLQREGWHPGIVSRGYGGRAKNYPFTVSADSNPAECGDEPLLIARETGLPVVVDPNRSQAVAAIQALPGVNVVLSDDGLQHYNMARTVEIAVVDGVRQFGNRRLLPAGPLREPIARLRSVDIVVVNGGQSCPDAVQAEPMNVIAGALKPLNRAAHRQSLTAPSPVHAVAAIGRPERFAETLNGLGYQVTLHPAPDHATLSAEQLKQTDGKPVVVTEKDAVKISAQVLAEVANPVWVLAVEVQLPNSFWLKLNDLLGQPQRAE